MQVNIAYVDIIRFIVEVRFILCGTFILKQEWGGRTSGNRISTASIQTLDKGKINKF